MTDMVKLKKAIDDSGMTMTAIAKKGGIARETLYNRLNGIGEFTASEIVGLSYALKVAEYGKVCILTKNDASESSTKYAQGGIAAVMYSPDSYDKHIQDTLNAGAGICDEKAVRITITESTQRVQELINWGTNFDKNDLGIFDLAREGGHSEYRILHHQDKTGYEIERALIESAKQHPNITIKENQYAVDLITQHHLGEIVNRHHPGVECYGAYVLNQIGRASCRERE